VPARELANGTERLESELQRLRQQVERLQLREKELRELLLEAHEQLLRRDEELQAALVGRRQIVVSRSRQAGAAVKPAAGKPSKVEYQQLITQIRSTVEATLPAGATVIVVSRGDSDLLKLEGRHGWHYPQTDAGVYAGYYPADSAGAIAHLEELKARGAQYLLFPSTAFWWFDHYPGFRQHLDRSYHTVLEDATCVIFALHELPGAGLHANGKAAGPSGPARASPQSLWRRLIQAWRGEESPAGKV
jgi:hypothetical protein